MHHLDVVRKFAAVRQPGVLAGQRQHRGQLRGGEPGGDVPGVAGAQAVPGDRRSARGRAVGVAPHRLGAARHHGLGPDVAAEQFRALAVQGDRLALAQRKELLDRQSEHLAQRAGVGAGVHRVGAVDDAGEVGDHQHAALLDIAPQVLGGGRLGQVEGGDHHQRVGAQVGLGVGEVDGEVLVEEGLVPAVGALLGAVVLGGTPLQVLGPPGVPVPQHGDVGADPGAPDLRQPAQVGAQLDHLAPDPAVRPGLRQHGRVVLLGAVAGGPPLEEHRPLGAAGDMGQAVAAQLAGALGEVAGLPVDGSGGVLQQQPGRAGGDRAGDVGGHRQVDMGAFGLGDQVVVVGDQVHLAAPGPVVDIAALAQRRHEVGGDRGLRGEPVQDVALGAEVGEHGVAGEALEVELVARVPRGGGGPRRFDLRPGGVALAPEDGAPGLVQRLQGLVALPQPAPEVHGRLLAVAGGDRCAVLVEDVPQRQRRMVGVALGQRGGDAGGGLAVGGGAVADRAAAAEGQSPAVLGDRQRVGVALVEPGRGHHRGGGQVHRDPVVVQQVQQPVQPAELEDAGGGLQQGPGEDADAHGVHTGLPHQGHVLGPDLLGPLLGVVVTAEREAASQQSGGAPSGGLCGESRGDRGHDGLLRKREGWERAHVS